MLRPRINFVRMNKKKAADLYRYTKSKTARRRSCCANDSYSITKKLCLSELLFRERFFAGEYLRNTR